MALPTLQRSDFTGSLFVNWQTERFDQYLTEFYPQIVRECIGGQTYEEVLTTDPLPQKYTDLFAGVFYDVVNEEGKRRELIGLTKAVKNFLWSAFVSDNFVPTNTGLLQSLNENSQRMPDAMNARLVQQRYNEGVYFMRNMCDFVMNYTDFAQPITGFVDNGGGSYTINTSSTTYLADSDKVTIAGVEYIVSNVVANTSFNITSTSATSFEGNYISNPFEYIVLGRLDAML